MIRVGSAFESTSGPVLESAEEVVENLCRGTRHLRVASAYLSVQGYDTVARRLEGSLFRLLVGSEEAVSRIPDIIKYLRRSVDQGPASDERRQSILLLCEELARGTARIRLFEARYRARLHAKVYLFDRRAAYVTSANLTHGGLRSNIEIGSVVTAHAEVEYFIQRFEELFAEASDLLPELLPALESSWAFMGPVPRTCSIYG